MKRKIQLSTSDREYATKMFYKARNIMQYEMIQAAREKADTAEREHRLRGKVEGLARGMVMIDLLGHSIGIGIPMFMGPPYRCLFCGRFVRFGEWLCQKCQERYEKEEEDSP